MRITRTMDSQFANSNFGTLPRELLIGILKYLKVVDLINFCHAYDSCDSLLQEKVLTRRIRSNGNSISRGIGQILESHINLEYVTTVNINDCESLILEYFIGKLVNLETLTALGTKLGLSDQNISTYKKTKLTKLAVTLDSSKAISSQTSLPNVKVLALEMKNYGRSNMDSLNSVFPSLEKIWVDTKSIENRFLNLLSNNKALERLQTIILSGKKVVGNLQSPNLFKYHQDRKIYQPETWCFEKYDNAKTDLVLPPAWKILEELKCEIPYGPKDARLLYSGQKTFQTILFEELNFHHEHQCITKQRAAFRDILMSPNSKSIKKLIISNCLLNPPQTPNADKSILANFKDVRHLELYLCPIPWGLYEYHLIGTYAQLRHFYVEISPTNDGSFLIDVVKNCICLETLMIKSQNSNDILNKNLYEALAHKRNLKEFTFKNVRTDFNKIISLLTVGCLKKLCLISEQIDEKFDMEIFDRFATVNNQLSLCMLDMKSWSHDERKQIQLMADKHKNPQKIFFIPLSAFVPDLFEETCFGLRSKCSFNIRDEFDNF